MMIFKPISLNLKMELITRLICEVCAETQLYGILNRILRASPKLGRKSLVEDPWYKMIKNICSYSKIDEGFYDELIDRSFTGGSIYKKMCYKNEIQYLGYAKQEIDADRIYLNDYLCSVKAVFNNGKLIYFKVKGTSPNEYMCTEFKDDTFDFLYTFGGGALGNTMVREYLTGTLKCTGDNFELQCRGETLIRGLLKNGNDNIVGEIIDEDITNLYKIDENGKTPFQPWWLSKYSVTFPTLRLKKILIDLSEPEYVMPTTICIC